MAITIDVKVGDTIAKANERLKNYSSKLEGRKKEAFDMQLQSVEKNKQDILNKIEEKATKSPKFKLDKDGNCVTEGIIFETYGYHGLALAKKLNSKDSDFKNL